MPIKMKIRSIKSASKAGGGDIRFDRILCVFVCLCVCVFLMLGISLGNVQGNRLGNAWSFSEEPKTEILSGTSGHREREWEWLTGEPLEIKVVNPGKNFTKLSLYLKFGISPCGTFPSISPSLPFVESGDPKAVVGEIVLGLKAASYEIVKLTFDSKACKVKGDPRNLIGSLFQPVVTNLGNSYP